MLAVACSCGQRNRLGVVELPFVTPTHMFTTPGARTRDDPTGLGRQTIMEKSCAYRTLLLFLRSRVLSGLTGGLTVTPPNLVASRTRLNLAQSTSHSPCTYLFSRQSTFYFV